MNDFVKAKDRVNGGFKGAVYRAGGAIAIDALYLVNFVFVGH